MSHRAHVDHAECVSSGACVLDAPDAFGYQDGPEALAVVLPGAAHLSDERLVEIAGMCPVGAIHVYDAEGTEITLTRP